MILIKYKNSHEKIAMDLLSFMPSEQNLATVQKTLKRYEENRGWQLYLCKQGNDYIGIIGIELKKYTFEVHHICVSPAFQGEGAGHGIVQQILQLYEPLALCATTETKEFLAKCWDKQYSI